jgi:ribonuclease HI
MLHSGFVYYPPNLRAKSNMSSWQPDSPVLLPDGSWVCAVHHLVVCGICTVDYSFMQDSEPDNDDDDDDNDDDRNSDRAAPLPWNRLTTASDTRIPETKSFVSPNSTSTPQTLFPATDVSYNMPHRRFLRGKEMLIYTDGACLNNGQSNPQAGWAFVFRDTGLDGLGLRVTGTVSSRLEDKGPSGLPGAQTSNRAELRAVIAALQFRAWYGMGEKGLVIATDSEYVVLGITEWVHTWAKRGWLTRSNQPVKNQDLWHALLAELREYKHRGMDVKFWRIPRQLNTVADQAAKQAATEDGCPEFCRVVGFVV